MKKVSNGTYLMILFLRKTLCFNFETHVMPPAHWSMFRKHTSVTCVSKLKHKVFLEKKIIKYVPFDTFFMFYISLFNISNFEVDVTVACFRNIDQCKCGIMPRFDRSDVMWTAVMWTQMTSLKKDACTLPRSLLAVSVNQVEVFNKQRLFFD